MNQDYEHKVQTLTHPWDGDIEDIRSRLLWFSLIIASFVILFFQTSNAQKVIYIPNPDISENSTDNPRPNLTRAERRFAEDYQEIIEKLEFLIRNHIEYFAEYKEFEGRKYQNLLLKTLINIENGTYCVDVDKLSNDVEKLITSLKSEEKILRDDKSLRKLYKNVRTLRTDFQMIEDILLDDISLQLDEHGSSIEKIKTYLVKERKVKKNQEEYQISMYELQELLNNELNTLQKNKDSLHIILDDSKMKEFVEAQKLQTELNELLDFVFTVDVDNKSITFSLPGDSTDQVITIPEIKFKDKDFIVQPIPAPKPVPPVGWVTDENKKSKLNNEQNSHGYSYLYNTNDILMSKQYSDTLLVKSSRIPIDIINQIGDVEIKGWDKNTIVADYSYQVKSDSKQDAKEFLESISLGMESDKNGIHIASVFPSVHNSDRQITSSLLILYIPNKNAINITNSFGRTVVTDFASNVYLQTKNSDVMVKDIIGNVSSVNKNGLINFTDINGNVDISSNRSQVILERLNSTLTIVNSHGPITIDECSGNATIENSGVISVNDHTGNLDIINDNGQTSVQSVTGKLELRGAYKPLFVQNINGSINIENKNANINVSDISGESVIINESGVITAENINGRVDFSNYGGQIFFKINRQLNNNSIIRSDYGLINIDLPQKSNILLNASTEGGSIMNSYNTKIENKNFVSSTTIGLGNKKNTLDVSGTNARIVIIDSK